MLRQPAIETLQKDTCIGFPLLPKPVLQSELYTFVPSRVADCCSKANKVMHAMPKDHTTHNPAILGVVIKVEWVRPHLDRHAPIAAVTPLCPQLPRPDWTIPK